MLQPDMEDTVQRAQRTGQRCWMVGWLDGWMVGWLDVRAEEKGQRVLVGWLVGLSGHTFKLTRSSKQARAPFFASIDAEKKTHSSR